MVFDGKGSNTTQGKNIQNQIIDIYIYTLKQATTTTTKNYYGREKNTQQPNNQKNPTNII